MSRIYVLHENPDWVVPLWKALDERGLPFEEWFPHDGKLDQLDLTVAPPQGVFYNRMSASSHDRGHKYAPEFTAGILSWLESHGRSVVNGRRAVQIEVSKIEQFMAFRDHDIPFPRTVATIGKQALLEAAARFDGVFMTKHNRAGRGLGTHDFDSVENLRDYVYGDSYEEPRDGITLLQEYIRSPDQSITRVEFVGAKFLYAVRVDTEHGYRNCPADGCSVSKFSIRRDFDRHDRILEKYARLLKVNKIDVAALEFVEDQAGNRYTFDLNTNTNYNAEAERDFDISGMGALADFLGAELTKIKAIVA